MRSDAMRFIARTEQTQTRMVSTSAAGGINYVVNRLRKQRKRRRHSQLYDSPGGLHLSQNELGLRLFSLMAFTFLLRRKE